MIQLQQCCNRDSITIPDSHKYLSPFRLTGGIYTSLHKYLSPTYTSRSVGFTQVFTQVCRWDLHKLSHTAARSKLRCQAYRACHKAQSCNKQNSLSQWIHPIHPTEQNMFSLEK